MCKWSLWTIVYLQISGHKRVDSVNAYADLAEEENIALGRVLGRPTPASYNAVLNQPSLTSIDKEEASTSGTGNVTGLTGQTIFQNCTIQHLSLK
jgi:hypothetical protein